jgi:hypothetical protein
MPQGIPRLFENSKVLLGDMSAAVKPDDLADPDLPPDSEPEYRDAEDTSDVDGPNANADIAVDTTDINKPAKEITPAAPPAARRPGEYDDLTEGEPEGEVPELEGKEADAGNAPAADDGEFTPELLETAKGYGIDEAAAKRYGSPDNLQWAMAERDRARAEWGQQQIAAMMQQQAPQQAAQQQQQAPAAPAAQPQQQVQQQQQPNGKINFDRAKYSAQNFDNDTLDMMSDLVDQFNSELEKVATAAPQAVQQQITSQSQAEAQARFVRDMDAFIDELGPEWEDSFGKGPAQGLAQGSPQLTERQRLASTVVGLYMADAQSNQPQVPVSKQAQLALNALHFKKQQEIALKQKANAAGKRRGQAIARAGAQRSAPMTGEEKAIQRSRSFDRKHKVGV